ncbi:MAG TPA: cupin domain-containing protein [Gaiellaceae bacterium]
MHEDDQYEFQSLEELADAIDAQKQQEQEGPPAIEVWQDYDPSQRFVSVFSVTEAQGARSSTVAYYIFEPGKHSGLHHDNAEEVIYIADGEGEIFVAGAQQKLEPGTFLVIGAGVPHDIYAHGDRQLQLLSFFPTSVVESTFQDPLLPLGSNVLASNFNQPQLTEVTPDDLPPELRHLAGG